MVVFDYESKTFGTVYHGDLGVGRARLRACRSRRRPPDPRRPAPGPPLAAREAAVRRGVGPPRRLSRLRREFERDSPAHRSESGRPRALAPRAARDPQRAGAASRATRACHGVPRSRAERPRSDRPVGHRMASARRAPADGVRPRGNRTRRAGPARAKLWYTNLGFALAPNTFTIAELRDLYAAALGHDVSATNPDESWSAARCSSPRASDARPDRPGAAPPRSTGSGPTRSRSPTNSPCSARPRSFPGPRRPAAGYGHNGWARPPVSVRGDR